MDSTLLNKLQSLSKDEESFKELKSLVSSLQKEKENTEKFLDLVERAIQNDYDSILITELNLDDPGPRIVYVNDGFTKITGYERQEVIGKTPRILQGPKTDQATLARLKKRLKSGRAFFGQTVNYRKDGSEFVNQWDIHPLTDADGNLTHWVSYQHDITERKRAERSVIDTHKEFDDLREESKCTLVDVETDGTIKMANKSFRSLTGYEKDELTGRKIWELFPRKYRNSLKTRFDKQFDPEDFENQNLQGIIKHKKGFPIQVEGLSEVLDLQDGTIIRAEIKNISLQKRIMEALQKRNEDYNRIVDKATQFTYRITLQDEQPLIEYVSEEFEKVTGLLPETVTHEGGWDELVHDKDKEKVRQHLEHVLEEDTSATCEYRIRTRDGSYQKIIDYSRAATCSKNGNEKCVRGAISFEPAEEPA